MKIHKVLEGPYSLPEKPDWGFIEAYIEDDSEGRFDVVTFHAPLERLFKIVQHMKSPTLTPFYIEKIDNEL